VRRAAAIAFALALAAAAPVAAHVTVSPPAVSEDATDAVVLVTPNERPGHETTRLDVSLPRELEVVSAEAPAGWKVETATRTVTWSGGTIRDQDTVSFPVTLHGVGPAGAVTLDVRQGYEDGATVPWQASLTVLPASGASAPRSHPGRALIAAVIGVGIVGASLVVLRRLRSRPLQDR
jgi:hypothetical protein